MTTIFAEYVWIDGYGKLRSKNRVIRNVVFDINNPSNYPKWNYDGSSTNQATTNESEVILKPVAIFRDPFFQSPESPSISKLILCETYDTNDKPHYSNTRHRANEVFEKYKTEIPWYGIEQEFFLVNTKTGRPLGFPENHFQHPKSQADYYCGVGGENVFGRKIVMDAYTKCIAAGVTVSGLNAEVAPGQWEIQVGVCTGIAAADELMVLRYILSRVTEDYPHVSVDFSAKPVNDPKWNGSGLHTNFSTKGMRESPGGLEEIRKAIENMRPKHNSHMEVYGSDNGLRMTGGCETSKMDEFSYGIGDRSASIRIPTDTGAKGYGYLEDRRPSSSADPYLVTSIILSSSVSHS